MKYALSLILILGLVGCDDDPTGRPCKVTLYSGNTAVKTWQSSGRIQRVTGYDSDGWYFRDQATGEMITVTGTVVIERDGK